jgi:hypothetical protein
LLNRRRRAFALPFGDTTKIHVPFESDYFHHLKILTNSLCKKAILLALIFSALSDDALSETGLTIPIGQEQTQRLFGLFGL